MERTQEQYLLSGAESSEVTFEVRLTWDTEDYSTYQNFIYNDTVVKRVLESYGNGEYGRVFAVKLYNVWIESGNNMKVSFVLKSNGVEYEFEKLDIAKQ